MANNRSSKEHSFTALPSTTSSDQYANKNPLYETKKCCYVTWYSWYGILPVHTVCKPVRTRSAFCCTQTTSIVTTAVLCRNCLCQTHSPEKQKKHSPVKSQDIMRDEVRSLVECDATQAEVSLPTFLGYDAWDMTPLGDVISHRTVIFMTVLWPYVIRTQNKVILCIGNVITTPRLLYLLGLENHAMRATGQAAVMAMLSCFESRA